MTQNGTWMKRLLVLLALASVLACGDDDGAAPRADRDAGSDAGVLPRDMDATLPTLRVTNVGTGCDASLECTGPLATCAVSTLQNVAYPGGSCTASCLHAEQCGPNGECPFGELVANVGVGNVVLGGLTAGECVQRCAELGQRSSCREGFLCTNYAATSSVAVDVTLLPAWIRPVCLPLFAPVDGGTPDAATPDASDASANDARASLDSSL